MTQEEIKNYLEAQAELGGVEILFDEPWTMPKKVPEKTIQKVAPTFSNTKKLQEPIIPIKETEPEPQRTLDLSSIQNKNSKQENEFENIRSLDELYVNTSYHAIYQGKQIFKGQGPKNPKVFILLDSPKQEEFLVNTWQETQVGKMLTRLFTALSIRDQECYFSFMYKAFSERYTSPLLDNTLRQILQKEIDLVKPEILVIFGEQAMRQVLGRNKSLKNIAGEALQFANTTTVVFHDAREMLSNPALKRETWNIHIPKSQLFKQ